MTEHDHAPPICRYTARFLTHDKIELVEPGHHHVVPTAEAVAYARRILDAAAGPSPDIICEQIYPTESNA